MGKAPSAPKPTPVAPPAPPKPMEVSAEPIQKARSTEAKKIAGQQGRKSTLITSPLDKKTKIGIS